MGEQRLEQFELSIIPGTDVALFHWDGPITLDDRRRNLPRLVAFCRDHRVSKLLIDGRDQQSMTGTLESYEFGQEVPNVLVGMRIAVVHRPDDDSLPFIETVASNRGLNTRSFHSIEAARAWLDSAPVLETTSS